MICQKQLTDLSTSDFLMNTPYFFLFEINSREKLLYCTLVRPILEYGSCVWNPHYECHENSIERVQKKFLRFINYKFHNNNNHTYNQLLSDLNLHTLADRRIHRDLIMLFKLINSKIDCPDLLSRISFHIPGRLTRYNQIFHRPFHRTNYGANSFICRASNTANTANNRASLEIFSGTLCSFTRNVRQLIS